MNIVETVLELENVTMQFGGVVAVDSFSMHVDQGETVADFVSTEKESASTFLSETGLNMQARATITAKKAAIAIMRIHTAVIAAPPSHRQERRPACRACT